MNKVRVVSKISSAITVMVFSRTGNYLVLNVETAEETLEKGSLLDRRSGRCLCRFTELTCV